jgi:tetratricopeptide (TPR) repeat protein
MPRLSLCLIARNEEQLLPGCLDSVRGVVDEIVVVDTGSSDRTRELAARAGAVVIEQPWRDDFSAPRNAALKAATGDWILHLDADERLTPAAGHALKQAIARGDFACGMLRLHDATRIDAAFDDVVSGRARIADPVFLPRLLKHTKDLEYRGLIHESVSDWLVRQDMRLKYLDADVVHFGNVPELRKGKDKGRRNVDLLEKRCEAEPDSVVPFGYLALELLKAGEKARAQQIVDRGWAIAQRKPKNQTVLRLADARATLQLEQGDAHGVLDTVALAESIEGPQPDLFFLRGCALELLGMRSARESHARARLLHESVRCFGRAQQKVAGPAFAQFMEGVNGWSALVHQGNALLALGLADDAGGVFTKAIALKPDALEAVVGLAEATLEQGDAAKALTLAERALGGEPDGWLIAAACAEALGSVKDLQLLFGNACERAAKGYLSIHRGERHAELVCLCAAALGRPVPGPGVLGILTGLLSRAPLPLERYGAFGPSLARVVKTIIGAGRAQLLEPLFEPRAEATFPGITAALAGLGITAERDANDVPAVVVPNAWSERWLKSCVRRDLKVTLDEAHRELRVQGLTLSWDALKADPVMGVRRLMARLGEADDDALIRFFIEEYPGAQA